MAFTLSNLRTQTSTGPASSLAAATVTASVGDLLVVAVAAANSGSSGAAVTATCADSAGNTYTKRIETNNTAGVADDGITLFVFTTVLTVALSSGTVTVSFSPDCAQGCAMLVKRYRPASGEIASFVGVGAGATGSSATPSITATSVNNGDMIVGAIAEEAATTITDDTDTSNGSWSAKYEASVGSGATAAHVLIQDKAVSATAGQTFNPTTSAAHDFAINYLIIRSGRGAVAAAGSYAVSGAAASLNLFQPTGIVTASAGAYTVTGQTVSLTKLKPPLYENSIAQNPFDYIHTTDPDQFERFDYLGLQTFEIYPATSLPTHVFQVFFRDVKAGSATLGSNPFSMTNGSAVVRVTHTAHGHVTGDHVTFSGASSAGGFQVSGTYRLTYVSDDTYDITHSSNATSTTTGGGSSVVAKYELFRVAMDYPGFSQAEAHFQMERLGPRLGKLPRLYRVNINYIIVHPGDDTFTSEDSGHFCVFYADRITTRISNNDFEESCFHEGTHAALQSAASGKGVNYIDTPEWAAAKDADGAYITEYASTADQEDFAESALFAYTDMLHPERMEPDLAAIRAQIPNRIAFFQNIFSGHITACARVPAANIANKLPDSFIDSIVDNTSLLSHCRDLNNLKVEAYYSRPDLAVDGIPDLYKFFCNVCGRVHPRSCMGNEARPYWEVR